MRNARSILVCSFIGALACGAALAQPAPGAAPPPPGALPPPPPPGAHVMLDRGANGVVHVDVKCGDRETTQDCASIAAQMLDKLGAEARSR